MNFITIRKNKELLDERSAIKEGVKSWDKLLLGLSAMCYLITIVVAGIDSGQLSGTKDFSWLICLAGVVVMIIGQVIFLTARSQNNFFSNFVRIQKDRAHVVCDKGLYKIVRHPGYLGMIISLTAIPLITTSVWSTLPTIIAVVLMLIRTSLEDKTLKNELEGYLEYSTKTRFKLLPFIW
jgi:protein-S-isoprenylcysteine O-methyltransferase Ste14